MWFFKKNRVKDIDESEGVSFIQAFFSEKSLREADFYLKSVGDAYWIITNGIHSFSIDSYHASGDFKGPMKFKKSDAKKIERFLNAYYKGDKYTFNSRIYLRICNKLNLTTGLYYRT